MPPASSSSRGTTTRAADHATWATLYARQREVLVGRASDDFLAAQDAMGMTPDRIPKFAELNEVLEGATGWTLIGVEGLLPELDFFDHLANRRFPVTWWIRKPEQIDYIEEPDLFHDLFGHVPLLMNPIFADYMQAYGRGGVKAHGIGAEALQNLTRLYWYTVEFGLIRQPDGLRIYGSGIVSSKGESIHSPGKRRAQPHRLRPRAHHAHALPHRQLPEDLFRHRQLRAADGRDRAGFRADLRAARTARIRFPRATCSTATACSTAAAAKAGRTTATCEPRAHHLRAAADIAAERLRWLSLVHSS